MIKKMIALALQQKHLREKFIRELRVNGLKAAIKKATKKASESFPQKFQKRFKETMTNTNFYDQLFSQTGVSDFYIPFHDYATVQTDVKLIAFYLPQFHPIPENDSNWGKGFTEWTNVSKAVPQYLGHHQPKLPGELGFYDLRVIENQQRQIELAKAHGIYGFCYYHYWFDGKKVMDAPIEQLLAHSELDFPFCINWANENWTKRWDGYDSDVILAQNHSPEDDIAFIVDIARYMRDSRYIRIDGKPLLMLYRPALLPNAKETAQRWRNWCRENGIGEIYLVATHSFEHIDPKMIDFDAAVEFAPNSFPLRDITEDMRSKIINPFYQGTLYDYDSAIKISNDFQTPSYKKFRGVCPRWDNEARKPGKGTTLVGSTPEKYEHWLRNICNYTHKIFKSSEQFVFINAWNEWAEGAYLEPDRKYGYAYLEATYKAICKQKENKIVIISHDAYFHGAQFLALNIASELYYNFGFEIEIVLCGDGPLIEQFSQIGNVTHFYNMSKQQQKDFFTKLKLKGYESAIANTVTVGESVEIMKEAGFEIISLIHEMENVIRDGRWEQSLKLINKFADKIIFPSEIVKRDFLKFASLDENKSFIRPQGLFRKNPYKNNLMGARKKVRTELNIPDNAKVVLNIAYGDLRKGINLFVDTGIKLIQNGVKAHFLWVGDYANNEYSFVSDRIKHLGYEEFFHFVGKKEKIEHYYVGSNVFFLSSREDPFPSVVMDAMNVGLPVVAFKNAGGFESLLGDERGILVEHADIYLASEAIHKILSDSDFSTLLSKNAQRIIEDKYGFRPYVFDLLQYLHIAPKKVSVIIPNYNYAHYLKARIKSILNQSYPIYELIILDDASTDNSKEVITKLVEELSIPIKFIFNEDNSGSVFHQWFKGMEIASGDYLWIAEADDLCESNFLETAMQGFKKDNVVISFTQSKQIDEHGSLIALTYLDYVNEINSEKWKKNYFNIGTNEIQTALAIKNTIPNVSGVVFKRFDLPASLKQTMLSYKIGGDWIFYVWLCSQGDIAFNAQSLNLHRRHRSSATKSGNNQRHYNEIISIQNDILNQFSIENDIINKIEKYREFLYNYLEISAGDLPQ